ncbi:MAG: glycerol-3-phosphate dehydrogenase C-terminal domain-containing protein [Planctomycetota bacterium]|nr:glycerol-3-phosphate dehydrogenase C-terminal domain-containing protein [Planctomycetota bacterium]
MSADDCAEPGSPSRFATHLPTWKDSNDRAQNFRRLGSLNYSWNDRAIVGTTDTPISTTTLEPAPTASEISFLLDTTANCLTTAAKLDDVLSVFTGIRPLVKGDKSSKTASLSRDHVIRDSSTGLITIAGGKWTAVRKMAEDCVDHAIRTSNLRTTELCHAYSIPRHGASEPKPPEERNYYGSDLTSIRQLEASHPDMARHLTPSLSIRESDIIWAIRHEMARTVDDVLSRRTRSLLLDSRAAVVVAPRVAAIMAAE